MLSFTHEISNKTLEKFFSPSLSKKADPRRRSKSESRWRVAIAREAKINGQGWAFLIPALPGWVPYRESGGVDPYPTDPKDMPEHFR